MSRSLIKFRNLAMKKKTVGLIATIGTTIICACPSLFLFLIGALGLSGAPFSSSVNGEATSQPMDTSVAITMLCVSLIGLATPVVVGVLTLRDREPEIIFPNEPLPPPS